MFSEIFIASQSHCSVKCGTGKRVVSRIFCPKSNDGSMNCDTNINWSEEDCDTGISCPNQVNYGPWSEWSKCSKSCIKSLTEESYQSRSRTCDPPGPKCSVGVIETKLCPVELCPPDCPGYHILGAYIIDPKIFDSYLNSK